MAVGPMVFLFGAAGVAALLAATSKGASAAPSLPGAGPQPGTPGSTPGTAPGVALPTTLPTTQSGVTLFTPGVWDGVPYEGGAQSVAIMQALGVDPTTGKLKPGVATPEAIRLAYEMGRTLTGMGHKDAGALMTTYAQQAEAARSTPAAPRTSDPITSRTPGVWSGLSTAEQSKVAAILKALGVDPATGAITPGVATPVAVQTATAMAGTLEHMGLHEAAAILHAYAREAAKTLPTPTVDAYASLPPDIATKLSRVGEYMNDPKVIRAFIGELTPYKNIPAVEAAIAMLEAKAVQLEALHDQRDVLDAIDKEQRGEPATAKPPSHTLPDALQTMLDGALNGLGVQDGAVKVAVTQYAIDYAVACADALEKNGYPSQAAELRRYITMAQAMTPRQTTVSPTTTTGKYTVVSGDSPYAIAKKLTGDPNRWRELIKANPQKAVNSATGNFKTLYPGEVLNLPAGWSNTVSGFASIVGLAC